MADTAADKKVKALEGIVAKQAKQIGDLTKKIEMIETKNAPVTAPKKAVKKVAPKVPSDIFEVAGDKYKFKLAKFQIQVTGGLRKMTAQEALKEQDVLDYLVKEKRFAIIEAVK